MWEKHGADLFKHCEGSSRETNALKRLFRMQGKPAKKVEEIEEMDDEDESMRNEE